MNQTQQHLLRLLADGQPHSGQSLGDQLGITRAAVWKHIKALREAGLDIEGTTGAGYRLKHAVPLLDRALIQAALSGQTDAYEVIQVDYQVDSTNRLAMAYAGQGAAAFLAEQQTAGRGRRGRPWQSPLGAALYLSVAWPLEAPAKGLSGLSLVAGLAVADGLEEGYGLDVRLKWPNDVQIEGRKLGGILIELSGDPEGPCRAVIGIGLNCLLPEAVSRLIDQPWTDLYRELQSIPDRNQLAANILRQLARQLPVFEREGFAAFQARWLARDALQGQPVVVALGERHVSGIARGVDGDGALCVATDQGEQRFSGGEVSVRPRS